jgi:hypothetical protein
MFCRQIAGQNLNTEVDNRSFENLTQFKQFGITVTNINRNHDEIERRMISEWLLPFISKSFAFSSDF